MRAFPYIAILVLGGLSLASVASSDSIRSQDKRPIDLISQDLGVTETKFKECFTDVQPARDHHPNGAQQRMNKAILLPCLQAANPTITNDLLDEVMDRYRPEGPMRS